MGGRHSLTPPKVIPLFLLVKHSVFSKLLLVPEVCQHVNAMPPQLLSRELRTRQQQGCTGAQQTSWLPKFSAGPETRGGNHCSVFRSNLPSSAPPQRGGRKDIVFMEMTDAYIIFLLRYGPSPLTREPVCPTGLETPPLGGQKGVSIVTCAFVQ